LPSGMNLGVVLPSCQSSNTSPQLGPQFGAKSRLRSKPQLIAEQTAQACDMAWFRQQSPYLNECCLMPEPLRSLSLRGPQACAQPPLSFKELDYGLLKRGLVRRGVVVAVTFGGACCWDFLEKPVDLLIGHVRLPIEYQDRHFDFPEFFRRPGRHDCTPNDSRQHLRIRSRHPGRYGSCRGCSQKQQRIPGS
jgi:hypothetical protein